MSEWFHVDNNQQPCGPLSVQALVERFRTGKITAETLVWRSGQLEWQPLRSVAQELDLILPPAVPLRPQAAPPPPPAPQPQPPPQQPGFATSPPQWGHPGAQPAPPQPQPAGFATSPPQWGHPGAQPAPPQPPPAGYGHRPAPPPLYAGFWKRALAMMLDSIILNFTLLLPGFIVIMVAVAEDVGYGKQNYEKTISVSLLVSIINIIIIALYRGFFESSKKQATLGKLIVGIKVVKLDGGRLSFGQAFGRSFAQIISGLPLYIGYMMAGWTERKQALHDMMAGTLVVNKDALAQNQRT